MPYNFKPICDAGLLARVIILFILAGVVTFEIPIKSEAAGPQPVIHADAWGSLPLRLAIDSTQ